jgi:hydrogenase-1 operon protein HyaF
MRLEDIPINPQNGQGEGEDPEPEYMVMPDDMATFDQPDLGSWEGAAQSHPEAVARLHRIQAEADFYTHGEPNPLVGLDDLDGDSGRLVNDVLGEGEVSIRIDGSRIYRIQESVLAGIWRVREFDGEGGLSRDHVEVGPVPEAIAETMARDGADSLDPHPQEPEAVNARALRAELADKVATYVPGREAHVINLTLLPMMPQDQIDLERIGGGPVTILSRGYGNCRITATSVRHLWRVQYFNSTDQLILDTLEVVDMPSVAQAAQEDVDESAVRLREMLEQVQ